MQAEQVTPAMARRIELWPLERLVPYARNARTHSDEQVAQIAASIVEFGFCNPILVDSRDGIVAGHGRLLAAKKLALAEVPVVVLDHLSDTQRRAYILADNRLALSGGWNDELLAEELAALEAEGFELGLIGFSEDELAGLLAEEQDGDAGGGSQEEEQVPEPPAEAVTRPGDLWLLGPHRLLCGDCRDRKVLEGLFEGRLTQVVMTSPPYAKQRDYDATSGFEPVPAERYLDWYRDVAAAIEAVLAPGGSYFLNIKEHAEDGQRHLYVKRLTIAHVERWGWRFVDEFCWRKTDNGVPGGWPNRFKNAWEPVFHFCRQAEIKFRPEAVGHISEDCFDYSPDNPKSRSGSGLLGTGRRGASASKPPKGSEGWGHMRRKLTDGRHEGLARPSNVIEARTESSQGSHSAPFPRAIPEFFIKAFSDPGDVVFDPFLGSGTTLVAAGVLDRVGYGVEISPAYCDVIVQRAAETLGVTPRLAATGATFDEVASLHLADMSRFVPARQHAEAALTLH